MKEHFSGKEVGCADSIFRLIYGQQLHIHGVKELDYTMILTTTYGTLERSENERKKRVNGETVWFKYPDIFWNYYS